MRASERESQRAREKVLFYFIKLILNREKEMDGKRRNEEVAVSINNNNNN